MLFLFGFILVLPVLLAQCCHNERHKRKTCQTQECYDKAYRILQYMNSSVDPCEDFYQFACGSFLRYAVIPEGKDVIDFGTPIQEKIHKKLREILTEKPSPNDLKAYRNVKHLYTLCMDEERIAARGVTPVLSLIEAAGGWPVLGNWRESGWNFLDTEIALRNLFFGDGSFFSLDLGRDSKNHSQIIISIDLPKNLQDNPEEEDSSSTEGTYCRYMVDVAVMFGADRRTAESQLEKVLQLESELRLIRTTEEETIDLVDDSYYSLQDLTTLMPWLDWANLLKNTLGRYVNVEELKNIVVGHVNYLQSLENVLDKFSNRDIANYMVWQAVKQNLKYLNVELRERYDEMQKAVDVHFTKRNRQMECIEITVSLLPLAVTSMFVRDFDDKTKRAIKDMAAGILAEMSKVLDEAEWMDNQTRNQAKYKVQEMIIRSAYPKELRDDKKVETFYRKLTLDTNDFHEAITEIREWRERIRYHRLATFSRGDWREQTNYTDVNAEYTLDENLVAILVGMLNFPMYTSGLPLYLNYATIGEVIGHEITHGFDDEGSQYDAEGRLNNWWQPESKEKFNKKKQCLIDQYGSFVDHQTKLHVNGVMTQGENIADNGGLKLAFRTYKTKAKQLRVPEPGLPKLQNYSNDQLFMLSFANAWCTKSSTAMMETLIRMDPHSPSEFRVNGVLMNFPEFSKIFQCKKGTRMNPKKKCSVW